MESIKIDILNPKALQLLKNLADLKLIKLNTTKKTSKFSALLKKLRATSKKDSLSLDEITKEVEQVRKARYGK